MSPRKAERKPQRSVAKIQEKDAKSTWVDYFRFGESYTSLILGMIVVIITTILLVLLVKDRSSTPLNGKQEVSSTSTSREQESNTIAQNIATSTPTINVPTQVPSVTPRASVTPKATVTSVPSVTVKPTSIPTRIPTKTVTPTKAAATVTAVPTVRRTNTPVPTKVVAQNTVQNNGSTSGGKTYMVVAGDSLWSIAEKHYKSGYNWVDIAKANNISNPSVITSGTKLSIPNVTPKVATVQGNEQQSVSFGPKITGTTYTVQTGDHLWGIAVRAYNDGYKWSEIARVNNISSPNTIFKGQVLKLPRIANR